MSRFRFDPRLDVDGFDDLDLDDETRDPRRRPARARRPEPSLAAADTFVDDRLPPGTTLSTYVDATRGPQPPPAWVITSGDAYDVELGVVKTGKEADVDLVERVELVTGRSSLLAAKRYRASEHRMFHRDAGYLEGRRVRRSREMRAMRTRTGFGRQLVAGQWAAAEFAMLGRLWSAGAPVPYPVQLDDTELLLEFIGDHDTQAAAPRLAEMARDPELVEDLWQQCRAAVLVLGAVGYTHGDLSPYNVLVHDGRLVLIDLPQVVDLVGNPQGSEYLARDCRNICTWFAARGVDADAERLAAEVWEAASR